MTMQTTKQSSSSNIEDMPYYAVHLDISAMYPNAIIQFRVAEPLLPWIMELLLRARNGTSPGSDLNKALKSVMCKVTGYMGTSIDSCTNPLAWCVCKSSAAALTRQARSVMENVVKLVEMHLSDVVQPPVSVVTDSMLLVAANRRRRHHHQQQQQQRQQQQWWIMMASPRLLLRLPRPI